MANPSSNNGSNSDGRGPALPPTTMTAATGPHRPAIRPVATGAMQPPRNNQPES